LAEIEKKSADELREALAMHAEDAASWCRRCDERSLEEQEARAQLNRESRAMQAEDITAWYTRETHAKGAALRDVQELTPEAMPSDEGMLDEGLGRVIVKARMTYRDDAGVRIILEPSLLELHVHERSVDAARTFLEANELKPHVIDRLFKPLATWLEEQVQDSPPELASTAYEVEGDFNHLLVIGGCL
jgi:hypothetical protein